MPKIERYLARRMNINAIDGEALQLTARPDIPASFPMQPDWLQPGQLFFGLDLNTGNPVHVPIDHLSHTLMQGPSGMGKSTFMHQLMASVLANADLYETIYMVDLKFGLEAQHYIGLADNLTVIDSHDAVPGFIDTLTALMDQRQKSLRERVVSEWDGKLTFVLIDEFADMFLGTESPAERKKLENKMVRLANLTRALGIRIWVQVQDSSSESMPTAFKRNLQSRIAFKMATNQEAAQMFGSSEGLPADMTKFAKGQVIYRDGKTSHTYALQGAFVRFEDVAKLAVS